MIAPKQPPSTALTTHTAAQRSVLLIRDRFSSRRRHQSTPQAASHPGAWLTFRKPFTFELGTQANRTCSASRQDRGESYVGAEAGLPPKPSQGRVSAARGHGSHR